MRGRAIGTTLVGAAMVLASCGTDRELTEPEPEPVTVERLAEAALTPADLPDGFTQAAGSPLATEVVTEHSCDDALVDLAPKLEHTVAFTDGTSTLSAAVAFLPGNGGAVTQTLVDVAEDCSQVVVADAGLAVRTGALDFGVLTDDTTSVRFEIEPATGAITERDLVLVRAGDLVHLIRLDGPRPSDKSLLDQVVRVAIDRLSGLHDATT